VTALLALLVGAAARAAAAPTTQLDFEGVDVNASAMSPELRLVQETLRSACPEGLTAGDPAWEECVVNLSYPQIKAICGNLGASTPKVVDALFDTATPVPRLRHAASDDTVYWTGCMWSSATGAHTGGYRWVRAGGDWILTDLPRSVARGEGGGRDAAALFGAPDGAATGEDHGYLAFRLNPRVPGEWLATPSEANQDHLNRALRDAGLTAPFCGTIHPGDPPQGCIVLPAMFVRAVSPTLVVLRSVRTRAAPDRVYGILWQSVTGHDILGDVGPLPATAPAPAPAP
jgi:hypothetical protein